MGNNVGAVISAMIDFSQANLHDVEHFLKVYGYAKAIGELEGLDARMQQILEVAAVVHDIGIPPAREKYGSDAGPYQEELGPVEAERMLRELGFDRELIDRVCFLVGHHHTYTGVDGIDYRILLEADFLVNAAHNRLSKDAVRKARESIFETETGRHFLDRNFEL